MNGPFQQPAAGGRYGYCVRSRSTRTEGREIPEAAMEYDFHSEVKTIRNCGIFLEGIPADYTPPTVGREIHQTPLSLFLLLSLPPTFVPVPPQHDPKHLHTTQVESPAPCATPAIPRIVADTVRPPPLCQLSTTAANPSNPHEGARFRGTQKV